ncbi:GNAT family N-acetyltransferase [Isachenkonia alkalipeptolytica]|uniref:GNAT family N-acetyltransferase n=1 Tax=Isachenkonia alkalipeptolytica TaxID=2565777 RepID=A0AA43XL32_9CLOT|nr:GNAT family N-acetyltransferase [Isachenkonia alkalipeptolytica]NBG88838.1 GNAT family N-acetyltransferase [Isachenkonia alkalipeptolytica]
MELQYEKYTKNQQESVMEMIGKDPEQRDYLRSVLELESGKVRVVYGKKEILGLVQIEPEKDTSFVIVYVPLNHRNRGLGSRILQYAEEVLHQEETKKIMTTYSMNHENSKGFAKKHGYERLFSSAYLKRSDGKFTIEQVPVRPYRDEDFEEAFTLSAKAFHEMRLRVGDFPDSAVGKPSEGICSAWKQDAGNRYIYELNGEIAGYGRLEGNEIESISVRTDLQGQGIGMKFTRYLCNELYNRGNKEIYLWCVVGNKARNLYDHLGFREVFVSEFALKSIVP